MSEQYKIQQFNISANVFGRDCLFVSKLREKAFDDKDVADILDVYNSVCPHCFDAPKGCNCMRDD